MIEGLLIVLVVAVYAVFFMQLRMNRHFDAEAKVREAELRRLREIVYKQTGRE
jgi:hypothetical protein